jgi:hypothetical protein
MGDSTLNISDAPDAIEGTVINSHVEPIFTDTRRAMKRGDWQAADLHSGPRNAQVKCL